ncbi:MAG: hypothetical protein A2161_03590 [Candidatus Schekmanbacteria bacterium RBG_13_48_7]|uniref:tetrahydrofolate synthase n=1 Tax=Candidatus Schekmanbacteria bacterium RBG_13_48_7 TaxID=1817878 RepID=A0A1F7RMR2_9BACT|nr:MAG: hypothetical protein A2161_03590 [Candidatus Schekmanbacteria bacterium RBG_13_48_7]
MINSIQSAKDFLYSFANYESKMPQIYNTNVFNMTQFSKLLSVLGNPHDRYPCIHIAGTKGKGSTAAMLASVLNRSGYRTGLYHSPHLRDTRERVQINDEWIPEQQFIEICDYLEKTVSKIGNLAHSYRTTFELLTALAFLHFERSRIEVAVIETGLGGRLDSTNVISPILTIITRIGKDHTKLLGRNLAAIASEKGGIIKAKVPVIIGKQHYLTVPVLSGIANGKNAPFIQADKNINLTVQEITEKGSRFEVSSGIWTGKYFLRLPGWHQLENVEIVLTAAECIVDKFPNISRISIQKGLELVEWPGRFQVIRKRGSPVLLLDSAHNPDSIRQLVKSIRTIFKYKNPICIFAVSREKQFGKMGKILSSVFRRVFLPVTSTQRNLHPTELAPKLKGIFPSITLTENVEQALKIALKETDPDDLVCVTGSFYLIGDVLSILDKSQKC